MRDEHPEHEEHGEIAGQHEGFSEIASPERGAAALRQFTGSRTWQLRLYAARAAAQLKDRVALDTLGKDDDDNVREAAVVVVVVDDPVLVLFASFFA